MPITLSRKRTMPNCRPMTAPSIRKKLRIGLPVMIDAVAMPSAAPPTVGTMVRASSMYVLRRTFCVSGAIATPS